jgi:hypothetical protein
MRNNHLDALRGYCLLAMTVDHLKVPGLARFTSGSFGLFDTAEGFIFISGLVAGGYYLRLAETEGNAAMTSRALRRSGTIYLTHFAATVIALGTILLAQGRGFGSGAVAGIGLRIPGLSPTQIFATTLTLVREPAPFSILPLYVLLILLVPILVASWTRGWMGFAVGVSAFVWLLSQPGVLIVPFLPHWLNGGAFNIFSWQFLFVCAFTMGCRNRSQQNPKWFGSRAAWVFALVTFIFFLALRHSEAILHQGRQGAGLLFANWLYRKPSLGPLCILDFAIFAFLLTRTVAHFGDKLEKTAVHRYLCFIGQHSLQVFAWTIMLVCFLPFAYKALGIVGSPPARCVVGLIGVLSIFIPAWLHAVYRDRRKKRMAYAPSLALHPVEYPEPSDRNTLQRAELAVESSDA